MEQVIQKWGNSLAIRIPKNLALDSNIEHGSVVEISVEKGKIVLKPVKGNADKLNQLLEKVTAENIHGEVETNSPHGKEVW
jgi:antitoxin MazE